MTPVLHMLRLLLGGVMVITALDFFLPPLVPFLAPTVWTDPMAVRLLGVFDASGLLAVAKCIQLLGGALLLFNRAVPFALAAMMPVHVCGAFIAVLIEGAPLLAVLALLVLALNGLLMLAYLPAYHGVLAANSLADGEAWDDGANYNSLFVNPNSRPSRGQVLAGLATLIGALAFYYFVVPFANSDTGLIVLVFPAAIVAVHGVRLATGHGQTRAAAGRKSANDPA